MILEKTYPQSSVKYKELEKALEEFKVDKIRIKIELLENLGGLTLKNEEFKISLKFSRRIT